MTNRGLLILALLAGSALSAAIYDPFLQPQAERSERLIDAEALQSAVWIEVESGALYRAEKREAWLVTKPALGPVDSSALQSLRESVSLLRSRRRRGAQAGPSVASIRLGQADGSEILLRVGAKQGRLQWVEVQGAQHLVEAHLVDEALRAAARLTSSEVLGWRFEGEGRLRLSAGERWMQLEGGDIRWPLAPAGLRADAAASRGLRQTLRQLSFATTPAPAPCQAGLTLVVEAGVQQEQLQLCGPCGADTQALRVQSSGRAGCVPSSDLQAIETALRAPDTLVAPLLEPQPPARLTLRCSEGELAVDASLVDSARLQEWWQALRGAGVGIRKGQLERELCTLSAEDLELVFGTSESGELVAQVKGQSLQRVLSSQARPLLEVGANRFRSLQLIEEEAIFATRIRVESASGSILVETGQELGKWQSASGGRLSEKEREVVALAEVLAHLRAQDFVASNAEPLDGAAQIEIDFDAPTTEGRRRYTISLWGKKAACAVRVDAEPWARLAPLSCQQLWGLLGE